MLSRCCRFRNNLLNSAKPNGKAEETADTVLQKAFEKKCSPVKGNSGIEFQIQYSIDNIQAL
jgi:hypothetical protein